MFSKFLYVALLDKKNPLDNTIEHQNIKNAQKNHLETTTSLEFFLKNNRKFSIIS